MLSTVTLELEHVVMFCAIEDALELFVVRSISSLALELWQP